MKRLSLAILLLLTQAPLAHAANDLEIIQKVFPHCTLERCVIKGSMGGYEEQFLAAAKAVLRGALRTPVVIDGWCASSCAVFTDAVRANPKRICITPVAEHYFHKGYYEREVKVAGAVVERKAYGFSDTIQSKAVMRWIRKKGGLPVAFEYAKMLKMPAESAARFWRLCGPDDIRG